jgi:hypothetical protein
MNQMMDVAFMFSDKIGITSLIATIYLMVTYVQTGHGQASPDS